MTFSIFIFHVPPNPPSSVNCLTHAAEIYANLSNRNFINVSCFEINLCVVILAAIRASLKLANEGVEVNESEKIFQKPKKK